MISLAVKLLAGLALAVVGRAIWTAATGWKEKGEIPEEWVESVRPRPWRRSDPGFLAFIGWQRAMAVLVYMFAGLCLLSAILQVTGVFP